VSFFENIGLTISLSYSSFSIASARTLAGRRCLTMIVKIVGIPPGSAPVWVRGAWVDVSLPIASLVLKREGGYTLLTPVGLTPRKMENLLPNGRFYGILCKDAIECLEDAGKIEAASFWRRFSAEGWQKEGDELVLYFPEDCCRLMEDLDTDAQFL